MESEHKKKWVVVMEDEMTSLHNTTVLANQVGKGYESFAKSMDLQVEDRR